MHKGKSIPSNGSYEGCESQEVLASCTHLSLVHGFLFVKAVCMHAHGMPCIHRKNTRSWQRTHLAKRASGVSPIAP